MCHAHAGDDDQRLGQTPDEIRPRRYVPRQRSGRCQEVATEESPDTPRRIRNVGRLIKAVGLAGIADVLDVAAQLLEQNRRRLAP